MNFIVSLLGARMHFAVPRILHEAGLLERLFTDFSSAQGWPRLLEMLPHSLQPEAVRRLLSRRPGGLPNHCVKAFNSLGLEYARRRRAARTPAEVTAAFLWSGREFCRRVNEQPWGNAKAVFTFNSAGLETLQLARKRGMKTVMEQTIAPKAVEMRLMADERERWSGWEVAERNQLAEEYSQREQAEWALADVIVCGSEFVSQGIADCGGPAERCVVVPYGVDLPKPKAESRKQRTENNFSVSDFRVSAFKNLPSLSSKLPPERSLRVLTVGGVGLRKGSPYVLEAAKRLKGVAEFRMVGPVSVLPAAEKDLRANIEVTGSVPRSEVARHYVWADVFLLPSICEGSATVTYEAMGHGLPVVCTPNTGSVVRDGVDGFIVPIRDVDAIVDRLQRLAGDFTLRTEMSSNARGRAEEFTVEAYGQRLLTALA